MLTQKEVEQYANGELDILDDFEYYSVFLEAVEQISNKTKVFYSEEDDLYSETTVFHLSNDCYLHFTSTYDKETKDILYEEIQYFTPEYFYE